MPFHPSRMAQCMCGCSLQESCRDGGVGRTKEGEGEEEEQGDGENWSGQGGTEGESCRATSFS